MTCVIPRLRGPIVLFHLGSGGRGELGPVVLLRGLQGEDLDPRQVDPFHGMDNLRDHPPDVADELASVLDGDPIIPGVRGSVALDESDFWIAVETVSPVPCPDLNGLVPTVRILSLEAEGVMAVGDVVGSTGLVVLAFRSKVGIVRNELQVDPLRL